MRLLTLALLSLTLNTFGALVDYRAFDPLFVSTNAGIIKGMWGTNAVDGSLTNRNQLAKWHLSLYSNSIPLFRTRSDGSLLIGRGVAAEMGAEFNNFGRFFGPYVVSMTDSNEPGDITFFFGALNNQNYNYYSTISGRTINGQQGGSSTFSISTFGTNAATQGRSLDFSSDVSNPIAFSRTRNGVVVFTLGDDGDLDKIKSLSYSWPTGYGAAAGYALTDTNGAGALSFEPGLTSTTGTNIVLSLATNVVNNNGVSLTAVTNAINQNARIGPGTVNFLSKFLNPTNVTDTRIQEVATNEWWWGVRTNLGAITNETGLTNRFWTERTDAANNQSIVLVQQPPGQSKYDELRPDRGSGDARAMNKFRLWGSWDVNGFGTNTVGEGIGHWLPFTDYISGTGIGLDIGNGTKRIRDLFSGRAIIVTPSSTVAQFSGALGGAGYGISTDATGLLFWRDTGATAGFVKERTSAALVFDLAGNGLGFGSGLSNIIAGFVNSSILGVVQMGVTNSGSVAPASVGLMGAQATGVDKGGADIRLIGGPSTGTGTNGNVRLQTSEKALASSGSLNSSFKDRLFVIADPIILTTNSATIVANLTIPTALRGVGGTVHAHTEIENGVDIATTDETFTFTANRKGSTVVTGISAPITCTSSSGGSAAIANTWSAVANSTSVDLKLTCVTSGINSTNSTVRVTFIPNSSAVPVITHP